MAAAGCLYISSTRRTQQIHSLPVHHYSTYFVWRPPLSYLMAADKTSVAGLANLGLHFMTELGMPETALEEFVRKVCCKEGLESLTSVKYWGLVTANHFSLEKKIIGEPFKADKNKGLNIRPENLDLNQPAPQSKEPCWGLDMMPSVVILDRDYVEVEATKIPQGTRQKRKITEAGTSGVKRAKVTEERAPPAKNDKGKDVIEVESWGEN